jgi:hypothetical protein
LLGIADHAEAGHFLIRRYEKLIHVLADFFIREGLLTEGLSVVSGELRIFKVSGHVQDENQLVLLEGIA